MGLGSFLGKLVGSGVGTTVESIGKTIDKFVETPDEKRAAETLMAKLQQNADQWQVEVNKIEEGHRTIFVAGWRPFVGWVCGMGLCYYFILSPFVATISVLCGFEGTLPQIAIGPLITILLAMLGMSATRTYEKINNLTS